MNSDNEDLILNQLLKVSSDIGSIKALLEKLPAIETRISALEATANQEVGSKRTTNIVSHVVSTVVGFAIAFFTGHH
jgi:peroxiredoxin